MEEEQIKQKISIENWLYQKAEKDKIPLSGTFELSPLCNFNCKMCYIKMTTEEMKKCQEEVMTLEKWKEIADRARKEGMLYLLLTGGEPFLWPDFWELYDYLTELGFVISINTNGSLIDDRIIARLREKPPSKINVTLYGASEETYKKLCGNARGYACTRYATKALKAAGLQVKLNLSLTPYNANDLEEIVQFSKENELMLDIAPYMFPPMRRNPNSVGQNDRFTAKETAYWQLRKTKLQKSEKEYIEHLKAIRKNMINPMELCGESEDGKVLCRAGKASFWITWDGKMIPCGMLNTPMVSLMDHSFQGAWNAIVLETEKIRLSGVCKKCSNHPICHSCAAVAYAETGVFNEIPEYMCEMALEMKRIAIEQLKIYGE